MVVIDYVTGYTDTTCTNIAAYCDTRIVSIRALPAHMSYSLPKLKIPIRKGPKQDWYIPLYALPKGQSPRTNRPLQRASSYG